jgi:DNA-binding transcriptional MocR family regulator
MKHQPNPKIFDKIAEKIAEQIHQGVLAPGAKVPSLRRFSRQLGVNQATVNRAYWKLENDGLLECRPQSGFYVRPSQKSIPPEPQKIDWKTSLSTTSMDEFMTEVDSFGESVRAFGDDTNTHLTVTQPPPETFPVSLLKIMGASHRQMERKKLVEFSWPPGNLNLRRQISRHYLDCGLTLSPDEILTTAGCTESVKIALRSVTRRGDIIALESPLYTPFLMAVKDLGLKVVEIPLDPQEGMDLDALRRALKRYKIKACLSIPNFNSPMGCLMPDANKKRLVEMLAHHDVTLIEDDVLGDLYYGTIRPKPAKAFDKQGNVILCSSFAKTLGRGLRVGWLSGGKTHKRAVGIKFTDHFGCDPFNEWSIGQWMEKGGYQRHLRKMRKFYASNLSLAAQTLIKHFPGGTRISRPAGGLVFWVEFPLKVNSSKIWKEATSRGIIPIPGNFNSLNSRFPRHTVISFSRPLDEKWEKAIKTVGDLAKKQIGPS